jgi:hypothetical protein
MKTEFCSACGHKIEYNFAPPNFCSKCGNSLRAGAVAPQQAEASISAEIVEEREEVPSLAKLEYTVSYDGVGNQKLKLGDLALEENSQQRAPRPKKIGRKPKPLSREEFLVKSVAECRSVGNNSEEVSGK